MCLAENCLVAEQEARKNAARAATSEETRVQNAFERKIDLNIIGFFYKIINEKGINLWPKPQELERNSNVKEQMM